MKVTNWRRKIAASLVAGGMMAPTAAAAADLNVNLITNPGFEDVDTGTTCCFGAVQVNSWTDGTQPGFAYNYNLNYDNGGPLAGGGTYYFTSNGEGTGADITVPGQVAQNVDVSAGATGALIASGEAALKISGFFSSYLTNNDFGTLHVSFLDGGGSSLGTTQVSDSDVSTWTQSSNFGLLPAGTATLQVSVFGTPFSGGPDGYIDNVDVQVTSAEGFLMFLEVETDTGIARLRNNTGETVNIDYYEIVSASSSLTAVGWSSLQDQDMAGFPAGNGSGNGWEEAGGSTGSSTEVLSESYLLGNSAVADQASIGLGGAFNVGGTQDLVFRYSEVAGGGGLPPGDFNQDGSVNAADYAFWRDRLTDGANYTLWQDNFGVTGGPSGPGTLVTGFVRYVTSGSGSALVPEPSSVVLIGIGLGLTVAAGRRNGKADGAK